MQITKALMLMIQAIIIHIMTVLVLRGSTLITALDTLTMNNHSNGHL